MFITLQGGCRWNAHPSIPERGGCPRHILSAGKAAPRMGGQITAFFMELKQSFPTWRCVFSQGIVRMLSWSADSPTPPPARWKRPQSHSRLQPGMIQPKTGITLDFPASKRWGITPGVEKRNKPATQTLILTRSRGTGAPQAGCQGTDGDSPQPSCIPSAIPVFSTGKQDGNAPLQSENRVILLQGARLGETPKLPK